MNKPLFIIIFKDNTKYVGGNSYFETKWLGIPLKPIETVFYLLPTGDYLTLTGEKFFHMVEATSDLTGELRGQTILRYAYIMAQKNDKIISYRITLFNNSEARYRTGDITVRVFNINDEKIKGLNLSNWR